MNGSDRGEREYHELIGSSPAQVLAEVKLRAPDLYETVIDGAFAGPLARPELSRLAREIATIAILASGGGAERQLATHTRAALRCGLDASELLALLEHVLVYAGAPRALGALSVVGQVLSEAGIPVPAPLERVRLGDHETVVAKRGENGPAVLLVHALGLDWRMWDAVMSGVDRIVDVAFGVNLPLTCAVIATNGVIASYSSDAIPEPSLPFSALMRRSVTIRMILVFVLADESIRAGVADVTRLLAAGELSHPIAARYPLRAIAAAHNAVESDDAIGKVMVLP